MKPLSSVAAGSAGNPWLIGVIADLFEVHRLGEYFDSSLPQRGGILSSHTSTRVPHPALLDVLTRVPDSSPFVGPDEATLEASAPVVGAGG